MKNFVVSLAGLSVLLSLTACGTEVKTKEYYIEHMDEAKARYEECEELKSERDLSKDEEIDCRNALQATFKDPNRRWNPEKSQRTGKDGENNNTNPYEWK